MNEIKLHPEAGVGIYFEQFKDSLDDLSWLFIILLHHSSRDEKKCYPQVLSKGNNWCHLFVKSYGLNPDEDIYTQLERIRGGIYKVYNERGKPIYSYKNDYELDHRYDNLKLMIDIVRVVDCIDAGSEIRPYQFEPKDFEINVTEMLRAPKGEYDPRVLESLEQNVDLMKEACEKNQFDLTY